MKDPAVFFAQFDANKDGRLSADEFPRSRARDAFNFLDNMDYDLCFARGIHVLTTGKVFAQPVAEIGLALAMVVLVLVGELAERWTFFTAVSSPRMPGGFR